MAKVWLVTGCSRGLGRALAEALLEGGEKLVATARSVQDLAFLPKSERVLTVALDVTDAEAAHRAVDIAIAAFGRIDVVVSNAGFIRADSVEDQPEEAFRRHLEINFYGTYHLAHAALPLLRKQGSGRLIFVSSIGARCAVPGLAAYQSAKAAVAAFSEVLAKEVAPLGLHVTCVEPGGMRTDMFDASMLSKELKPHYEPTIGTVVRSVFGDPLNAGSDPTKVAQAIIRVAHEPEPPVRLLLGSDAYKMGTAALANRVQGDEQWKELSLSTDY